MQFTLSTGPEGLLEIAGRGRLNMVAAPRLREVVADAVAEGARRVVINLAEVDFMDSSGLGALIGGLKTARQAGGDLRIAQVQPQVMMVLELTGMQRVLTPYPTVEDAYAAC